MLMELFGRKNDQSQLKEMAQQVIDQITKQIREQAPVQTEHSEADPQRHVMKDIGVEDRVEEMHSKIHVADLVSKTRDEAKKQNETFGKTQLSSQQSE